MPLALYISLIARLRDFEKIIFYSCNIKIEKLFNIHKVTFQSLVSKLQLAMEFPKEVNAYFLENKQRRPKLTVTNRDFRSISKKKIEEVLSFLMCTFSLIGFCFVT